MRMNQLKYDVASIYIAPRGQTFYFIYNNNQEFFESKGMDLSSLVYMLLFKLRDFQSDNEAYVELLQKGKFDYRDKSYYDEEELLIMAEECLKDEDYLFKKREHEIDLSLLEKSDEIQCMAYVSQFNPRRNFYNGYCSSSSNNLALISVLMRESNFNKMVGKIIQMLESDINTGNTERIPINKFFDIEEIKYLITGANGDLWYDLYLKMDIPEREKYSFLYQAQPRLILDNEVHRFDVDYVRCAIDGVKCSHKKMKALFADLPLEMQENKEVFSFYSWHRECSL
jgi:hypothetical protein